jgi:hypothetical protein
LFLKTKAVVTSDPVINLCPEVNENGIKIHVLEGILCSDREKS